MEECTFTPNV
jgi:hypothetical protein